MKYIINSLIAGILTFIILSVIIIPGILIAGQDFNRPLMGSFYMISSIFGLGIGAFYKVEMDNRLIGKELFKNIKFK